MSLTDGYSRGTLILAVRTPHGAYLTADSRLTNPSTDSGQKLFKCGEHAFIGLTGHVIGRPSVSSIEGRIMYSGVLNISEILRHLSAIYDGDGSDLPERIAGLVFRILEPWWRLFIANREEEFIASCAGSLSFCEVPVLSRIGAIGRLSVVRFPFSPRGELLPPEKQTFDDNADGDLEEIRTFGESIAGDFAYLPLGDRAAVLDTVSILYQVGTSTHPHTVGGPIDIGFIDDNGASWIVRKKDLP